MEGIKEKFLYGRVLGKGSFCVVKSIASHANIVSKHPRYDLSDSMTQHAYESLENELNILRTLRHPNIISVRSVHNTSTRIDMNSLTQFFLHYSTQTYKRKLLTERNHTREASEKNAQ